MKKSLITILKMLLIILLLIIYWVWMLYTTQAADASNTYQIQEEITAVNIRRAVHRGSDTLYISTPSYCYKIDTGWQNESMSNSLAQSILSTAGPLTITIWERYPIHVFDTVDSDCKVRQIVDLRNEISVYWDILEHNRYQKHERIVGAIAGIFISIISAIFLWVWCLIKGWFGTRGRICCPTRRISNRP